MPMAGSPPGPERPLRSSCLAQWACSVEGFASPHRAPLPAAPSRGSHLGSRLVEGAVRPDLGEEPTLLYRGRRHGLLVEGAVEPEGDRPEDLVVDVTGVVEDAREELARPSARSPCWRVKGDWNPRTMRSREDAPGRPLPGDAALGTIEDRVTALVVPSWRSRRTCTPARFADRYHRGSYRRLPASRRCTLREWHDDYPPGGSQSPSPCCRYCSWPCP
jgi:hypothetical protein